VINDMQWLGVVGGYGGGGLTIACEQRGDGEGDHLPLRPRLGVHHRHGPTGLQPPKLARLLGVLGLVGTLQGA
jgi:hypothetical protein